MTPLANIQAEGDDLGGLLQLLALVAMVIVIAVAKWLGNKLEQKQSEQQAVEQARRQLEARQAPRAPQPAPQPAFQTPQAPPAPPPLIVLEPARQHGLVEAEVALPSVVHHDAYRRSAHGSMPSAARGPLAAMVDLSSPDALRQAVIYHELLSPPKALRRDPDPWDS